MIACRASLILMSKRERDFSRALISRRRVLSNLLLICCFSQFDPFCKPHVLGSFNLKISPFNSTQGLVTWFSTSMRLENHNFLRRLGSEQTNWTSSIVVAMIWKNDVQFKFHLLNMRVWLFDQITLWKCSGEDQLLCYPLMILFK